MYVIISERMAESNNSDKTVMLMSLKARERSSTHQNFWSKVYEHIERTEKKVIQILIFNSNPWRKIV